MSFIESSKIYVFPATKRGETYNQKARLLREESFTESSKKLVDTSGFIISDSITDSPFMFCINGYFISVDNVPVLSPLFVNIGIHHSGDYKELIGQDDNGIYNGLVFTAHPLTVEEFKNELNYSDTVDEIYSLQILNDLGEIPDESRIKLKRKSISVEYIDGGTV